jgi:VIT1/CCC1 family predicted Fe2+/Mn2+ transporter
MERWRRWPVLVTGLALIASAVGVGVTGSEDLNPAAQVALMALGAAFLGAFLHAEGVRDNQKNDDTNSEE